MFRWRQHRRKMLLAIMCLQLMAFLRIILVPNYNVFLPTWWQWSWSWLMQDSCTAVGHLRHDLSAHDPFIAVSVVSGSETWFRTKFQAATWAAHSGNLSFHNVSFFDENDVAKMPMGLSCQEAALICDRNHPPTDDELWEHNEVFTGSRPGWWCFQSRGLIVLDYQLRQHPNAGWFFLVNDDTYVNVPALKKKAGSYSATSSACALGQVGHLRLPYFGDTFWHSIIWDGAGILINRNAADRLLQIDAKSRSRTVIEQCIYNTRKRSKWCWWHSDWVLSACLQNAGISVTSDKSFVQFPAEELEKAGFDQETKDSGTSLKKAAWIADFCSRKTTCHKRTTMQSMLDIHNALKMANSQG